MLLTILILFSLNPTAIFCTNNTESNYVIKERGFSGNSNITNSTYLPGNVYTSNGNLFYNNINQSIVQSLNFYNSSALFINGYVLYINGSIYINTINGNYYGNYLTANFLNISSQFEESGSDDDKIELVLELQNVSLIYEGNNNNETIIDNNNETIIDNNNETIIDDHQYENTESTLKQIFRRAINAINEQRQFEIYPFYHLKVKSNKM